METSFYTQEELKALGFASLGDDVAISRFARLYNPHLMHIGTRSRIDDFCVLSGNLHIGAYVHIAVQCALFGGSQAAPITLKDFSGLSARVSVYAKSDDYSGEFMTNPTLPELFTHVVEAPVVLEEHAIVGAGSVLLPGVTLERGAAVGALSLVKASIPAFEIHGGVPARRLGERSRRLEEVEYRFVQS